MTKNPSQPNPLQNIIIKGAKMHNLKNIDVVIPRNKLVVITGLSGSGKSSLAFDTLYAEGQRRYVESLSSYARQFMGKLNKPKVDDIKGIAPAIAIEQKVNSTNPRSTVGTTTEIYDYLKLLYARIGKTYSPISGKIVKKDRVADVIDMVKSLEEKTKLLLLAPVQIDKKRKIKDHLEVLIKQGYSRIMYKGNVLRLDEALNKRITRKNLFLVVDRIVVKHNEDFYNRLADAVENAFYEGHGHIILKDTKTEKDYKFSNVFERDGMKFLEPNIHLFSFNNPYGACPECEGYGDVIGLDENLIIPNTGLSVYENAIYPWRGDSLSWYRNQLVKNAHHFDFPVHKPYYKLSDEQKDLIWEGNEYFTGLNAFFKELEAKSYKIQNRVLLSRYRGKTKCKTCKGKRLRPEANYVKIQNKSISELVDLSLDKILDFFKHLNLSEHDQKISKRLLKEITTRLQFLIDVGLSYLTLNRKSNTLSGGESQRINLATSLGSSLVGSMYILDEPSIGLHSRDGERLIGVLKNLRDLGNTVIVVEHDEDIMREADLIIDIGPEAGVHGGEVVAYGDFKRVCKSESLTGQYLSGRQKIEVPKQRRQIKKQLHIKGARDNNLKDIDVNIPLNMLTLITGVSGSGKSTLVKNILYPALCKALGIYGKKTGQFDALEGDIKSLEQVEYIDQNPIGRSSRSNPVTYAKAYDDIRYLFAEQKLSKLRNFKSRHFSFNVDGGRCEKCQGEGEITIQMQFMVDVHILCDACQGKRFKPEVIDVEFEGKNIDDILNLSIDEAIKFFGQHKKERIVSKLKPLQDVGLGYVALGQSSSTLSGGEAQRIKLATFLGKSHNTQNTLFIFDEPTTGLHFHDIKKLLKSFDALIEKGHSIIVIEHQLDLIKCADHIIDLGLEGGENGGYLVAEGTPEDLVKSKSSLTAKYLKSKLES
ncbi:excinuclease ABC subunit UvrA [Flavobacterium sp. CS20]|uniref:excinuclease ABC subunit UvrA n=1 Tax=Flavobacterium sp. CS20 TaxID=2775246 RepID=UPI001B39F12E|nr:excinuclease ABC subunit UvrA [Flavobacterium sp. CS20]QTY27678.1 excinuclease ABC subunit UvrA [Flavobacterium sp. CS20]